MATAKKQEEKKPETKQRQRRNPSRVKARKLWKFTAVFVCDSVKESNYGNQVEKNKNGTGVTRNEPDYRLNPPITSSPLQQAALYV